MCNSRFTVRKFLIHFPFFEMEIEQLAEEKIKLEQEFEESITELNEIIANNETLVKQNSFKVYILCS